MALQVDPKGVREARKGVGGGMSWGSYTTAPGIRFGVKAASRTVTRAGGRVENGVLVFGISAEASGDWGEPDGAKIARAAERAARRELEKQSKKLDGMEAALARVAPKVFGMMEKAE